MSHDEILIALDGSEFAERSLDTARRIATATGNGLLLYGVVVERHSGEVLSDFDERTFEPISDDTARRLERAQAYLDAVADRMRDHDVPVRAHCSVEVDAADGIVREAVERGVLMVVMTSHGRSGLGRWLLGSVSERVLRASRCRY
jgi:nucleotide-binding universal stress UspA family protein